MKKLISILLCLIMAVSLCACGSKSESYVNGYDGLMEAPSMAAGSSKSLFGINSVNDFSEESRVDLPESFESGNKLKESESAPAKIIKTANISCETTDFDTAISSIEKTVKECGGYFNNSSLYNYDTYRTMYYTVRVPENQFDIFCSSIGELCQIQSLTKNEEDVSEYYYDTEARLLTAKTKLERLQKLLSEATNMEDIISLESAISNTEYEVDNLSGTVKHYDSLVNYSTINLNVCEVYKLSDLEKPTTNFFSKLFESFKIGWNRFIGGVENVLFAIAESWVLIIVLIAAIYFIVKFTKKRRLLKKAKNDKEIADKQATSMCPYEVESKELDLTKDTK